MAIRRNDDNFLYNILIPLVLNNTKHLERNVVLDMISNCDTNTSCQYRNNPQDSGSTKLRLKF